MLYLSILYNTPHSPILFFLHLSDLYPTSTHIHTLMKVFENNSGFKGRFGMRAGAARDQITNRH